MLSLVNYIKNVNCSVFMYSDDATIVAAHRSVKEAGRLLQNYFHIMQYHDNELVVKSVKAKKIIFIHLLTFVRKVKSNIILMIVCRHFYVGGQCSCKPLESVESYRKYM